MQEPSFDRTLAQECAKAFSESTGLGCTLSDAKGQVFADFAKAVKTAPCARLWAAGGKGVFAPMCTA